ncbi:hypothetical protein PC129_g24607 [Phytophthora cactorum]|uniref:Tc3 transposase DNA binding domain-containing protein n=1 Tax=Phytophthora cactorum TaxID=29920 RepID=A0A8T1BS61_9STRA|nr:hypothetical protein Pcac1_g15058 [Phytophthora cactorum]KAG2781212.1 hypothetical protein PC112_g24880 [Phytophthora cactorum]KAG2804736.1 hypothetical protein PC111_g18123 [Phytophthora cactorum]KAG2841617.1 hypothetical protein PC113_g18994 [Phytophthora cactorum]KAG2883102.1 hypothetical protein PC114_g20727 [Phytophthora cactorum]
MPRGKGFSELEQGQMLGLRDSGLSYDAIAEWLKRSKTGIYQVLKNPEAYNTKKRLGRPSKLTEKDSRRLLRAAHTGKYSSTQLVVSLELPIKARRERGILHNTPTLKNKKRKKTPALKPHQKNRASEVGVFQGTMDGYMEGSGLQR